MERRASARRNRGIALVSVLLATALLLALVAVLVDLGTVALQRSTENLRAVQAMAGADAGTAWARAVLEQERGNVDAAIARLAKSRGRRRFTIDGTTYVVASVSLMPASGQPQSGDHADFNVESNPQVPEALVQVQSSASLYVSGRAVAGRSTTTLLRVFGSSPYSETAGSVDNGGVVGIESPGDAGGQTGGPNDTQLLVHAYVISADDQRHDVSQFDSQQWSDGNAAGSGPLP